MAHGQNEEQKRRWSFEFWSRRPYFGEGKAGKVLTHRYERRAERLRLRRLGG